MPAQTSDAQLAFRARRILETADDNSLPMTYQQLAEALGLAPPGTIQRVALALEALMREDAEQGRPFIAALVISRRGELPRQGFFDLAVDLGRFPATHTQHDEAYRAEFARALAMRG